MGYFDSTKGKRTLKRLKNNDKTLTTLALRPQKFNADDLKVLAPVLEKNTTLTELGLSYSHLGEAGMKVLAPVLEKNTTLTKLGLSNNSLGVEGIKVLAPALEKNTTLTTLDLGRNSLGEAGMKVLAPVLEKNTTLTELGLMGNSLSEENQQSLVAFLERNRAFRTQLFAAIRNHQRDQVISLLTQGVSPTVQDPETFNTPLHEAILQGQEDIATYLLQFMRARKLPLTLRNRDGKTAFELAADKPAFAELFATPMAVQPDSDNNNNVSALAAVSLGYFDSDEGKQILERLKNNDKTLTTLGLRHRKINADDLKMLAPILEKNTALIKLDLSNNSLGVEGIKVLAPVLEKNTTLTELGLRFNVLSEAAMKVLAPVLEKNTTLTTLYLGSNALGEAGMKVLASVLEKNTTLTKLDLGRNALEEAEIKVLAPVLEKNTTLTTLDLSDNALGEAGMKVLAPVLEKNTTLIKLNFDQNSLSVENEQRLVAFLERNRAFRTQLFAAIRNHQRDQVISLLTQGVSPAVQAPKTFNTPLHEAILQGQEDIATYLLQLMRARKLPLTLRNRDGKTAFELAADKPAFAKLFATPMAVQPDNNNNNDSALATVSLKSFLAMKAQLEDVQQAKSQLQQTLLEKDYQLKQKDEQFVLQQQHTLETHNKAFEKKLLDLYEQQTQAFMQQQQLQAENKQLKQQVKDFKQQIKEFRQYQEQLLQQQQYVRALKQQLNRPLDKILSRIALNDAQLRAVDLSLLSTQFLKQDVEALAESLKVNTVVEELWLFHNGFDAEAAKLLAAGLRHNNTLRYVNVDANAIGQVGATALLEALVGQASLVSLSLQQNQISAGGGYALAEILQKNRCAIELDLSENHLDADEEQVLSDLLLQTQQLHAQFFAAIRARDLKEVQRLVEEKGVRLLCQERETGHTPLHAAVIQQDPAIVAYLLQAMRQRGLSIYTQNAAYQTAALLAESNALLKSLFAEQIDPVAKNITRLSPLYASAPTLQTESPSTTVFIQQASQAPQLKK